MTWTPPRDAKQYVGGSFFNLLLVSHFKSYSAILLFRIPHSAKYRHQLFHGEPHQHDNLHMVEDDSAVPELYICQKCIAIEISSIAGYQSKMHFLVVHVGAGYDVKILPEQYL